MSKYDEAVIPVYGITRDHSNGSHYIKEQFKGKPEFDLSVIETESNYYWQTFKNCIQSGCDHDEDVIIICNESHKFTGYYNWDFLLKNILEAHQQNCDILCGGIGGFNQAVPITSNRYWVDRFWYCNFIVLFRKFFSVLHNKPFKNEVSFDDYLSRATNHKMVLFPFLSVQKDFSATGDDIGDEVYKKLKDSFDIAGERLSIYRKVFDEYSKIEYRT